METLYARLKHAERLNDALKELVEQFGASLEKYEDLPGYRGVKVSGEPRVDISQVQREVFDDYKENPILNAALNQETTILDSLKESVESYKRVRWYFPRRWHWLRKDKEYVEKARQLCELVNETYFDSFFGFIGHMSILHSDVEYLDNKIEELF